MRRPFKVALSAVLALAALVVAFVVSLPWVIEQPSDSAILEQQVLLANNAFLKVKGTPWAGYRILVGSFVSRPGRMGKSG